MLEGMISGFMPSRAEVMDVSNAVLDGADALMLSGETATGIHPPFVIETMNNIIIAVEENLYKYNYESKPTKKDDAMFVADSICHNATELAKDLNAKALIAMTASGYTAQKISSYRPKQPIFVFTDSPKLINRTALTWGAMAFIYEAFVSTDATVKDVIDTLKTLKLLQIGDLVVNTGSMPMDLKGKTNMLKVSQVQSGDSARH
jgi:pyruvate kinase